MQCVLLNSVFWFVFIYYILIFIVHLECLEAIFSKKNVMTIIGYQYDLIWSRNIIRKQRLSILAFNVYNSKLSVSKKTQNNRAYLF